MELIAEIGQNHDGDMGRAREMIHAAAEAGADAAKFQVYDAAALFPREDNPWYDYNLQTELGRDDVLMLAEECGRAGVEFLASVFDVQRVAWLEEAGVKRYKIASRSVRDQDLIAALAATGKPLIVSLGMWQGEQFPAIETAARVDYLFCVSKYPTPLEDLHLSQVDFSRYAGFSDHTVGISAALAALARGARILEKHLTLDKTLYGPDHACSMDMEELRAIRKFRDDLARCL